MPAPRGSEEGSDDECFSAITRGSVGKENSGVGPSSIYYSKYQYISHHGTVVMNFCISKVLFP